MNSMNQRLTKSDIRYIFDCQVERNVRLNEIREKYSVEAVAHNLGVTTQTVRKYERNANQARTSGSKAGGNRKSKTR